MYGRLQWLLEAGVGERNATADYFILNQSQLQGGVLRIGAAAPVGLLGSGCDQRETKAFHRMNVEDVGQQLLRTEPSLRTIFAM